MTAHFLLDLSVLLVTATLMGLAFRRIGQPSVLGEIIAGIVLGPTVLGALPGHPSASLFPKVDVSAISAIGQVALVLYMLLIGLRIQLPRSRGRLRAAGTVSLTSLLLPLFLSIPVAVALYPKNAIVAGHRVSELAFVLLIATVFAITAVPVLLRILADHDLVTTNVGRLATTSAIAQDLSVWILLAVVLTVARSNAGPPVALTVLGGIALAGAQPTLVRTLLRRAVGSQESQIASPELVTGVLGLAALSAACSAAIGLSPIFGALLSGVTFRSAARPVAERLADQLAPLTLGLLPTYFLAPGLTVDLRTIGSSGLVVILVTLAVASVGKVGGGCLGGRQTGLSWTESWTLGVLMNTRGLVELIVLQTAFAAGILGRQLFSELVVTALLATMSAGPLLLLLGRRRTLPALRRESALAPAPWGSQQPEMSNVTQD
jgi:Kef-type K+ transport system membrane component KefB